MGGAVVVWSSVIFGLADEVRIHLSPVVVGNGTPLFIFGSDSVALDQRDVPVTAYATHLTYAIGT
jgi:riboflavin biosynthesis pyrimidine reductase